MTTTATTLVDAPGLDVAFDREPLRVRHRIADHPLLTLEAIAGLVETHDPALVEHNVGDVPRTLVGGEAPRLELAPADIVRGIEENGCWMVVKNVERDPRYRDLLHAALLVAEQSLPAGERMLDRQGFLFVSAPGAVTPSHIDPEHNVLLQVRGEKTMHVGRFVDDETAELERERFYSGDHRNIATLPADDRSERLVSGDGIYMPVAVPHWVENHDEVSVSLSITFATPSSKRRELVWRANHRLRRAGLTPKAPGAGTDRAKATTARALRRVSTVAGRVRAGASR